MVDVSQDIDLVFESGFDVTEEIGMGVFETGEFDLLDSIRIAVIYFTKWACSDDFLQKVLAIAN